MKYEWRKSEKEIYLPKTKPEYVEIPKFNYFTIKGKGNPNNDSFGEYIGVLYAVSYAVRMSYKGDNPPKGYFDYTVYPLEGVWDVGDKQEYTTKGLNKDDLVFEIMIRQPEFVDMAYAEETIESTKKRKPHELLNKVEFKAIDEGACVQMMHIGSYDDEPESFRMMDEYSEENGLKRASMKHREIYLSDPRKSDPEKMKTVLRYKVERA